MSSGGKIKPVAYASLNQFLEEERPDLSDLFDLVQFHNLSSKLGVTLLLPPKAYSSELLSVYKGDKKALDGYKKEIEFLKKDHMAIDKTMGPTLLRWLLSGLVLTKQYKRPADFTGFIINKSYKKYTVKKINKDSVELDIGTITPIEVPFIESMGSRRRNLFAVWNLKGKPNIMAPTHVPVKEKKGGAVSYTCDIPESIRKHLLWKLKECYLSSAETGKFQAMELVYVTSFLDYLKANNQDVYSSLIPLLDWNPFVSFMIIFCTRDLIDEKIMVQWFVNTGHWFHPQAKEQYQAMMDESTLDPSSAQKVTNMYREQMIDIMKDNTRDNSEVTNILQVSYSKLLDSSHKVGSLFASHLGIYSGRPALKANHDVYRAFFHKNSKYVAMMGNPSPKLRSRIKSFFDQCKIASDNFHTDRLSNALTLNFWRDSSAVATVMPFVYSSDCWYSPEPTSYVTTQTWNPRSGPHMPDGQLLQFGRQRYDYFTSINTPNFDNRQFRDMHEKLKKIYGQ